MAQPERSRGDAWGRDDGQALVLGVLLLGVGVLLTMAAVGIALGYVGHADAQSAADAAALACASQSAVVRWVDARGEVYTSRVEVLAGPGTAAAAAVWRTNVAPDPLATQSLVVQPSRAICAVQARVSMRLGVLGVLGRGHSRLSWVTVARARAYAQPPH